MNICVIVDNPESWFVPFAEKLVELISHSASAQLMSGSGGIPVLNDVAFFLSCEKKINSDILQRSTSNIVVHASKLPEGKGMSPLTWQILEGKNRIPITLFEAVEEIDAGPIYIRDFLEFKGNELLAELQDSLGEMVIRMCLQFLSEWPSILSRGIVQTGEHTAYRRRTPADSALDPTKSLAEQFDLLRVVDNQKYPAHFELRGRRYNLKIEPIE
jgi:methionyl-tRNA formyltransferase